MTCPVCNSNKNERILKLESVPILQNAPLKCQVDAINVSKGNIDLVICLNCDFVFNRTFDEKLLVYDENYNNNQTFSNVFKEHIESVINKIKIQEECDSIVVEVGCGKGDFLKILSEKHPLVKFYGFDTTYVGEDFYNDNVKFVKEYFGDKYLNLQPTYVLSRHVIEHITKPVEFLNGLRNSLAEGMVEIFFETPDIEWIFDNNAFWDIFYEHCTYFTKDSLTYAFEITNFKVSSTENIFNGQYLWVQASTLNSEENIIPKSRILNKARQFSDNYYSLVNSWKDKLKSISGKTAIWGAGAKGVTFLNILDPNKEYIKYVIDINPDKQGKFIPGTGHEIIGYNELPQEITNIVIMNPNYLKEIESIITNKNLIVL